MNRFTQPTTHEVAKISGAPTRESACPDRPRFVRLRRWGAAAAMVWTLALTSSPATAQCPPEWLPGDGFDILLGGGVSAMQVLPNGDLVAGGSFTNMALNHIARWDGLTWSPLGAGLSGSVYALACLPNGDLVVGGGFGHAGTVAVNGIARWDGSAWWPLGAGVAGTVNALATLPNGHLVAAGQFSTAGGVPANNIAQWDGSSWTPLGIGVTGSPLGGFGAASVSSPLKKSGLRDHSKKLVRRSLQRTQLHGTRQVDK